MKIFNFYFVQVKPAPSAITGGSCVVFTDNHFFASDKKLGVWRKAHPDEEKRSTCEMYVIDAKTAVVGGT